ncbi:MAG: lamin tail domain-containing protein, partial [Planctomycetota bacterium]
MQARVSAILAVSLTWGSVVQAQPDCTITAELELCADTAGHTASVPDAGPGATYEWLLFGGTITGGAGTREITYAAGSPGLLTISVTVTDATRGSCWNAVDIPVHANPDCAITADAVVCAGLAGNTASVPDAGPGANYDWVLTGGTITGGAGTPAITYTAGGPGTLTISVTVTDGNGCICLNLVEVTVIAGPDCTITADAAVCADTAGYMASVPDAGTGATYAWDVLGGTITAGLGTPQITYAAGPVGMLTISVTVTDGCTSNCSDFVDVPVNVTPDCTITAEAVVDAGSTGHTASVPDAGMGATYDWDVTGGLITAGAGTAQMTYTAGPAGTLTISATITNSEGCACSDSVGVSVNARIVLNEYNAVGSTGFLEGDGEDTFWGRIQANGGDWFELAVIADHLDMRDWQFLISDSTGNPNQTLDITTHGIWSDLRSGTIITVSERLSNNVDDYCPAIGRWWLNVKAADDTNGTFITASNFRVNNNNWQLTIKDASGVAVFGPAGEGIQPPGGVGNDEVFKLEEDPGAWITPLAAYNDGHSSTFGSPNTWSGGTGLQDFSVLRIVVPYYPLTNVRVNEVLSHSDTPLVDWVELHNTTGAPVDIGYWYLSDAVADLTQFQIPPATEIPANGYLLFDETELGFAFHSSRNDQAYLSESNISGIMTGGRDFLEFGPAASNVSFGRYPNATGPAYPMTERTPGAPNAEPLVGPVVINEVMYHPPDLTGGIDNLDHEFVELHNIMDVSVSLYTYFAAVDETHPWKFTGGIDFAFSLDTTIAPYGYLLVVSFDPLTEPAKLADFLTTYGLGGSEPIVGAYLGKLSNTGETVRLRKPDTPELVPEYFVPYVVVDEVPYADYPPWPPEPDGQGPSLERIIPTAVGDVQT